MELVIGGILIFTVITIAALLLQAHSEKNEKKT
jgi:hypothetical protein